MGSRAMRSESPTQSNDGRKASKSQARVFGLSDVCRRRARAEEKGTARTQTRVIMSAEPFLAARDFLLTQRTAYDTAVNVFRWPSMESFNWALDYIDVMAAGNTRAALVVADEDGTERVCTFQQISERANRVASFFRTLGMKRGDRLLLMLGNEVPLWETFLACIKLGVVVIPATTLLAAEDILDRSSPTSRVRLHESVSATQRRTDGTTSRTRPRQAQRLCQMVRRVATIRSSFTSPREQPRSRSWCFTRIRVIRLDTCPPCIGWGCNRATSTGTSARQAGRSMPGAASLPHGMQAQRSSR
jgi:AMP-binding enzyme